MRDKASRITELEKAVAELREELDRLRTGQRGSSMRQTWCCPACGGKQLFHFRHITELTRNGVVELTLQKEYSSWWGLQLSAAPLEAYVCRSCRLVEWDVISLDDVKPDGKEVVAVEAQAAPAAAAHGPYR